MILNLRKHFKRKTGRRKSAVAQVKIFEGQVNTLKIIVNNVEHDKYFDILRWKNNAIKAINVLNINNLYIECIVRGGGKSAQAQAICLGISKCLADISTENRSLLKMDGLLRNDPRKVERQKPGQKGARGKYQYSRR